MSVSRLVLFLAVSALSGCRVQEYVVARDEVPLYETPLTRTSTRARTAST